MIFCLASPTKHNFRFIYIPILSIVIFSLFPKQYVVYGRSSLFIHWVMCTGLFSGLGPLQIKLLYTFMIGLFMDRCFHFSRVNI